MSEGILEIAAIDNAMISANVFNILNWMSSLFAHLHKYFVFFLSYSLLTRPHLSWFMMFPHIISRSRQLRAQFHPPVNPWCDVPMALNYVNCLPNQPVYKHQLSPNQRTADGLSPNRRPGREAAQFPPTNIATVELVTVVTSFQATPELTQFRPLGLKLKYLAQFMNKNNLITRLANSITSPYDSSSLFCGLN